MIFAEQVRLKVFIFHIINTLFNNMHVGQEFCEP